MSTITKQGWVGGGVVGTLKNVNHVMSQYGAMVLMVAQTFVIMRVAGTNPYSAIFFNFFGGLEISANNWRRR